MILTRILEPAKSPMLKVSGGDASDAKGRGIVTSWRCQVCEVRP